jgi:hypothetical protein
VITPFGIAGTASARSRRWLDDVEAALAVLVGRKASFEPSSVRSKSSTFHGRSPESTRDLAARHVDRNQPLEFAAAVGARVERAPIRAEARSEMRGASAAIRGQRAFLARLHVEQPQVRLDH